MRFKEEITLKDHSILEKFFASRIPGSEVTAKDHTVEVDATICHMMAKATYLLTDLS